MKITRYFQSCLLIEEVVARILIDPSAQEKDRQKDFAKLDAVLYTHEHSDHFDAELAKVFMEAGVPIYANASTAKLIDGKVNVVSGGHELTINYQKIKAVELPHCPMPDGSPGPQNTGYLINGYFFHPGDGKELADLQVKHMALPITGPDISMKDAFSFAKQLGVNRALAIHYDGLGAKPEVYAGFAERLSMPFKLISLGVGQTVEL